MVLQDLGLPPDDEGVEEGLACLRDILRLAPHTKVIVVTGNGQRDNALRAVAQGAYDFYQRPVDVAVLDSNPAKPRTLPTARTEGLEMDRADVTDRNGVILVDFAAVDHAHPLRAHTPDIDWPWDWSGRAMWLISSMGIMSGASRGMGPAKCARYPMPFARKPIALK